MTVSQSEVVQPHTRLLRIGLAEPESREYWRQSQRPLGDRRAEVAFEERWFGSRALVRVQYLINSFQARFDAYPQALKALHRWNPDDLGERRLLCHWHLQLSDPLYRDFSGSHLPQRMQHPQPTLDRNAVLRWVEQAGGGRWSAATAQRMAAGLMGVITEVGYTSGTAALRPISLPRVSDRALAYLMYLLRHTEFQGTLNDNPYLQSVGIDKNALEARLMRLPGIRFQKMSDLKELHFDHADLWEWACHLP